MKQRLLTEMKERRRDTSETQKVLKTLWKHLQKMEVVVAVMAVWFLSVSVCTGTSEAKIKRQSIGDSQDGSEDKVFGLQAQRPEFGSHGTYKVEGEN